MPWAPGGELRQGWELGGSQHRPPAPRHLPGAGMRVQRGGHSFRLWGCGCCGMWFMGGLKGPPAPPVPPKPLQAQRKVSAPKQHLPSRDAPALSSDLG